jgi:hypothetical protein
MMKVVLKVATTTQDKMSGGMTIWRSIVEHKTTVTSFVHPGRKMCKKQRSWGFEALKNEPGMG